MSLIRDLGELTHELNRAFCASIGDNSQVPWAEAPEWQKKSAFAGIRGHLSGELKSPEDSHRSWLAQKEADGWVYGEVKDAEKKTHPCFRPYLELPEEQRTKDFLFMAAVHGGNRVMGASEVIFSFRSDLCRELLADRIMRELWKLMPDTAFTDYLVPVIQSAIEVMRGTHK